MDEHNRFTKYIGSHENIMGQTVYVKNRNTFIPGKVVYYSFPKSGILGKYKVSCEDGKTRTVSSDELYIEK